MIKPVKSFADSTGAVHATLELAQASEIKVILKSAQAVPDGLISLDDVATKIVESREKIVDVLTTSERSLPQSRRINGGSKPRKPKIVTEPAD